MQFCLILCARQQQTVTPDLTMTEEVRWKSYRLPWILLFIFFGMVGFSFISFISGDREAAVLNFG